MPTCTLGQPEIYSSKKDLFQWRNKNKFSERRQFCALSDVLSATGLM